MRKILLLIAGFVLFSICAFGQDASLVLGNPSDANASDPDNFLISRKEFIVSYNRSRGEPNWVAWHLSKSDVGKFNRETGTFRVDELLPPDSQVRENVYAGSGYQLGHMCPSKDRSKSAKINKQTFVMSNVAPQIGTLNMGVWKTLETYTRNMVKVGWEAYIFAGCYGNKGRLKGQVTIPTRCFKVIAFLPEGKDDLARIDQNTRLVVVDILNAKSVVRNWRKNRLTLAKLEDKIGFHFLSTLSATVKKQLEKKLDDQ